MGNLTDTLIQAGLINEVQVQVAMHDLKIHSDMRLGEVLALRGWIDEATVDFFDLLWEMRVKQGDRTAIGQYFLEARLITEAQLNDVLEEQKRSTLMFGEIAILKGYLKSETVRFFVKHLFPEKLKTSQISPLARTTQSTQSNLNYRRTMSNDVTMQQTEENVDQENKQYRQRIQNKQQHSSPQGEPQKKMGLFGRLKQQVAGQSAAIGEEKKSSLSQEPDAFSTCFDLSEADDLDVNDI